MKTSYQSIGLLVSTRYVSTIIIKIVFIDSRIFFISLRYLRVYALSPHKASTR